MVEKLIRYELEKKKKQWRKDGKPYHLTKTFKESHLEENQWNLTIEGCNLAMKENIILFIPIHPFDLHWLAY